MTIAAGFRFEKGVLVCADTEVTQGEAKYSGQKIFPIQFGGPQNPGPKIAFAMAGWVPHAKRAIEMCHKEIREVFRTKPADLTDEGIKACIESGLDRFYRQFIFSHPLYGSGREPSVEFIIGGWSAVTGRSFLFSTGENVVNDESRFACIGLGQYIAQYVCANLYHYNLSYRKIVLLASHVLRQTKKSVPNCGKDSQMVTFQLGGAMEFVPGFAIDAGEVLSDKFSTILQSLYLDIVDIEEDFEEAMKAFSNAAMAVRAQTNIANQNHQAIMRFLLFNEQQRVEERKTKKKTKKRATSSPNAPEPPPEQSGGADPKSG